MRMIFKIYIIQAILVTLLGLSFMARPESWDSGKWKVAGLILAVLTFVAFLWGFSLLHVYSEHPNHDAFTITLAFMLMNACLAVLVSLSD